jgi:hypothetical protein
MKYRSKEEIVNVQNKRCYVCGLTKSVTEFNKNKHKADGCRDECKQCDIIKYRKYKNKNIKKKVVYNAKLRAAKKNLPFDIEESDIHIPDFCPVLGIPIKMNESDVSSNRFDNSPSIDRIDSSKGYTKDNIRIISHRANTLKNNATVEELKLILADSLRIRLENSKKELDSPF